MSERSKGDTSSPMAAPPPASARVVKNPLLSASVTGLTFDDFQNKPLLLPAAPPIIHPMPVTSSRESTPLVTVGKSSDIDSENLSEVNLNDFSGTPSNTADVSDENCNSLVEPSNQIDSSILSQAASSFSQLPSVASSVFSTFSKKFNSSSARDDVNFNASPSLNIQPFSVSQVEPQSIQPPPITIGNQEQQRDSTLLSQNEPQPPVEPPTFYSPAEVPAGIPCPPAISGQNSYRISVRKKIYAPIPGLSAAHQEQNFPTTSGNILAPIGFENLTAPVYAEQTINKSEESKGGLFSLSNFVPGVPNVLQNLSGLVQSAAGSFTQKSQEPSREQSNNSGGIQFDVFGQTPSAPYQADYFSTQQVLQQPQIEPSAPSQLDFFSTTQPSHQPHAYQPPTAASFFNPQAVKITQLSSSSPTGPQISSVEERKTPTGSFFTPISNDPSTGFSIRPPSAESTLIPPLLSSSTPEVQELHGHPPAIRPPSGGPPTTSFRLQKGVKLYKSPFASSAYQQQSFGGHIPGPQAPLTQAPIPATSFFVPPPQHSLPPQEILQPLPLEKDTITASVIDNLTRNPAQASAPSALEPVRIPQEVDNLSNLVPNQPLPVAPELTSEGPIQQAIPFLEENNSSKEQEAAAIINSVNLHETETRSNQETLSFVQATHQEQSIPAQPTGLPPPPLAASEQTAKDSVSDSESHHKKDILIVNQSQLQCQSNPIQFNLPPPPPAVIGGVSSTSKETANFPPPPPQHSLQEQFNSNPYRRGLQSHHSQIAGPTSLSSIFNPNNQEVNLFKPIAAESISKPAQEDPASIASFFAKPPETDVHANQVKLTAVAAPAPEISKDNQKSASSELFPSHTPPIAEVVTAHSPVQDNSQLQSEKLEISNATPIIETQTHDSLAVTQAEATNLAEKTVPVSSFFATSAFVAPPQTPIQFVETSKEKDPPPAPPSNFTDFFASTEKYPPAPSVETQLVESKKQTKLEPIQPAASVKIASPPKQQEIPDSQQSVPNVFTSFFDQPIVTPVVNQSSVLDPTSFFDSFGQVPSAGVDTVLPEDPNSQRIQNFFNNPPPKDPDPVGDLNYNLVGSGLSVKNLQTRSLTPASNLAEPPSSSCSEFSELNSSLSAGNRHPRVRAEDSNKVSPEEELIFEAPDVPEIPEEILNELKMANPGLETNEVGNVAYKPAVKHWFYKRKIDEKSVWTPFSFYDSSVLEQALALQGAGPNLVAVEGGRYDVNISDRIKVPVYWEGEPIEVKRCSWFYKAVDSKYVPYEEEIGDLLEEEYRKSAESGEWHKKIPISAGDMVMFHGPTVIVHFQTQQQVDSWGGSTQTSTRPRVVKRDLDDFTIDEGETPQVDHLLFMVHGIGSACDLKMRSVEEVVDEFRGIALQLVQSHYKNSVENGYVGRVEVLPVSWHGELHSEELGIDEKLKSITLESIPKLRNFTNDTLLDILFYTSPMFCQKIMNTVTASMNNVYLKYKQRNPQFHGGVSLAGHSLGSLILFDLLCHQRPFKEREEQNMENPDEITSGHPVDSNQLYEDAAKHISYKMGQAGTGQPFISYPQLVFQPKKFFALGSPIGMFVTIRGIDKLGLDFRLPTCPGFYNIFHPYDPVAYRLEALVNHDMNGITPVLIPHHKGRKRMHLELKETMTRVGADLKQRFFETFKTTFDTVSLFAPKSKSESKGIEKEVDKFLELQAQQEHTQTPTSTIRPRADSNSTSQSDSDAIEIDFPLGKLNDSKRIDYVLQEAPLEFFNEYLFALSSHVCYWESEDTILFVMKEIYTGIGISPDSQVPQQTMTIERPSSSGSTTQSPTS